jgi:DNA-binding MarR family transcriptional regulator
MEVKIDWGLTSEQIAAIRAFGRDYTIGEIAKKLGLTYAAVKSVVAADKKAYWAERRAREGRPPRP